MAEFSKLPATIVLVHGGFVDGAGWEGVYNILKKDGFNVSIVQNPTTTLADDVAATRQIIAQAKGPVVLVGHSYGGVVITESGNDPKVQSSSTSPRLPRIKANRCNRSLIKIRRPARPCRRSCRRRTATCSSTRRNSAPRSQATSARRRPRSWPTRKSLGAWMRSKERSPSPPGKKPSWYLIATEDKMIPPPAQRQMATRAGATVVEAPAATRSMSRSRRSWRRSLPRRRRP